jgi:hypothetical protein
MEEAGVELSNLVVAGATEGLERGGSRGYLRSRTFVVAGVTGGLEQGGSRSFWSSRMSWLPELLEISNVSLAGASGSLEHLEVARVEVANVEVAGAT